MTSNGAPRKKKHRSTGKSTAPQTIESRERAAKAMELRKQGHTFDEIAAMLGYTSKQRAYEAVKDSIARITREPAEELITLELERLDALWRQPYAKAQDGDVPSIAACMNIMQRRARLLGLDAPAKTENKTEVTTKTLPASVDEFV